MIGGALGRKMVYGHLSRRSPPLLRRMGWRAALLDKVMPGAGSSTWRSPPLLQRSPWTPTLFNKVVPGAGSSTPAPSAKCGFQAVDRPPPPVAASVGLHPAGHLSFIEVQVQVPPPPPVATRVGFHGIDSDADSSKAVPLSSPATTGVSFQGTDPNASMAVAVQPAPRAAVGVGLHPVGNLSSMDVQVPLPPSDVPTGVGFHGIYLDDPDSSKTVPLPPPATTGVGLQVTGPASSMAVPPAPPAAVGIRLLAIGHHSWRPLVLFKLLRPPRTPLVEMVVSGPGSPPQHGSPVTSIQPLPVSSGIDLIVSDFIKSMRFPLPVSHPDPLFIQENGRGFRRSTPHLCKAVSGTMTAAGSGGLRNVIIANQLRLTKNSSSTRLQTRSYSKDARIPLIPFDKTLPPPPPSPYDLTSAPKFDSALSPNEKMIAQDIQAVSYASDVVFDIMEKDKHLVGNIFLDVNTLKTMFQEYEVEEALEIRGLLWHHSLEDNPLTRCLRWEHGIIFGSPEEKVTYLNTWRLMEILIGMPRDYWNPLFDFLSSQRIIIYLDWEVKIKTWISFAIYDFGVECAPDNLCWYKSESDASFNKERENKEKGEKNEKADIGVLIWKDRKVVWCEIYHDFPCKNSVAAEATGMYLQLRRSIGLDYLKAHTDSKTISKVVLGKLIDGNNEEEIKLFKLLQVLTGYFRRVAPRWVPREEIKFVDGLLRNPKVMNQVGIFEHVFFLPHNVVNDWKPHLRGDPMFTIIPGKASSIGRFKGNYKLEYHDTCFLAVKENGKIDGIYHVIHALCPADVNIITNKAQAEQLFCELKKLSELLEVLITREESGCWTTFKMRRIPRYRDRHNTKDLVIVLDQTLPRDLNFKSKTFTVFVVSESEKNNLGSEIVKFSPLSFVSFQQFITK